MSKTVDINGREGIVKKDHRLPKMRTQASLGCFLSFTILTLLPLAILYFVVLGTGIQAIWGAPGAILLFLSTLGSLLLTPYFNPPPEPPAPYYHSNTIVYREKIRELFPIYSLLISIVVIPISIEGSTVAYIIAFALITLFFIVHVYEVHAKFQKANKYGSSEIIFQYGSLTAGDKVEFRLINTELREQGCDLDLTLRNVKEEWHKVRLDEKDTSKQQMISFITYEAVESFSYSTTNDRFTLHIPNTIPFPTLYDSQGFQYWEVEVSNRDLGYRAFFYLDIQG